MLQMANDGISKMTKTIRERVQVGLTEQRLEVKEEVASLGKRRHGESTKWS